eukprot:9174791-Alexandrium_andersonii.AAC.1
MSAPRVLANTTQTARSLRHTCMVLALPLVRLPCGGYDNLHPYLKKRETEGRETERERDG